jgi:hypothetical protein
VQQWNRNNALKLKLRIKYILHRRRRDNKYFNLNSVNTQNVPTFKLKTAPISQMF